MQRYTLIGYRVSDDDNGRIVSVTQNERLVLSGVGTSTTTRYSLGELEPDGGFRYINFPPGSIDATLNGFSLSNPGVLTGPEGVSIVDVTFAGGSATVLLIDFEDHFNIFVLRGSLPNLSTPAQWEAFDRSITSVGNTTGELGPNREIPISSFGGQILPIPGTTPSPQGDDLSGGLGADVINALDGNDTLRGGDGNDTLNGGAGADVLEGGDGIDTADYTGSRGSLRVDLLFSQINTNIAAGDTYDSIENLIGSQGFDNLRGTTGENLIIGNANVDYIFGRAGNDTLRGGVGDDVLFGGVGQDQLFGGANRDRAQYSETRDNLRLDLANTANNTGEAAGDTYDSIEDLAGGFGNDTISGDGGSNRLFGREGADVLAGLDGDDYLNGGANGDRLSGGLGNDTLRGGQNDDTFVFGQGADVIEDFSQAHGDRIELQSAFLGNVRGLSGQQIVDRFAEVVDGDTVLTFAPGRTLTLQDYTDLAALGADVFVI